MSIDEEIIGVDKIELSASSDYLVKYESDKDKEGTSSHTYNFSNPINPFKKTVKNTVDITSRKKDANTEMGRINFSQLNETYL